MTPEQARSWMLPGVPRNSCGKLSTGCRRAGYQSVNERCENEQPRLRTGAVPI